MKIGGGHFAPKLDGHFELESGGHFKLELGGQYHWNLHENHPQSNNQEKLLPILSNQKMNSYLKEIAAVCEIEKELTFHIARHTFATTVTLTNGVPIESVSKMLGHKNLRTTQHYAKVLDRKVSDDMKILKDKFTVLNNSQLNKNVISS